MQHPADDENSFFDTVYQKMPWFLYWVADSMVAAKAEMPRIHTITQLLPAPSPQAVGIARHITNGGSDQGCVPTTRRRAELSTRPFKNRANVSDSRM